ncbi:MAG: PSD1 and planctomycete cytochrome C domain-containing protein [Fimbriiglobus sp.]
MLRTLSLCLFITLFASPLLADDGVKFYETKVRPLLVEQCYSCHSASAKKLKGDLKLDGPTDWLRGGSSGPAIVVGKPDESPLIHSVRRNHKEFSAMPPEKPLTAEQVAVLVKWVEMGAPAPTMAPPKVEKETIAEAQARWPYNPIPRDIREPEVKGRWAETIIDKFLLAKMQEKGLEPVGDAPPHQIYRRLSYDLTGLPPTPEDTRAFEAEYAVSSELAMEAAIDRLLGTRAYAERWGRHWLDVVRYADTAGDNSDFPIPQMVKYRDYVIDSFAKDKPFDQFVREQIAGDLMGGKTEAERQERIIATGYLANSRRFGSRVDDYPTHLTIEDSIENMGRAFLGLSLNCARCHDHKFDPISMNDYYAIYGILNSTRYPWPGIELEQRQRDLVPLIDPALAKKIDDERNTKLKALEKAIADLDKARKDAPATEDAAFKKKIDDKKKERAEILKGGIPYPSAYAMAEGKKRGNVAIQMKGDPEKPGPVVPRGFLEVLGGTKLPANDSSSGRLALAEWMTSPDNPLLARVFVNRVWQHHFGRGLVPTPNDFGKQGTTPTHPELLDRLAKMFIDGEYSVKRLHKRILMSRAYRLSSQGTVKDADTLDPNNELLTKFRKRRLDAESIRDTLLIQSGLLDTTPAEAHPFPDPSQWNFTQHNPFRAVYATKKRSVYLMTQRIQRHPYLMIFDGPDTNSSTGARITSTTPLQSLYFLNDPFVHEAAQGISKRLPKESKAMIEAAYPKLLNRSATESEVQTGLAYLRKAETLTDTPEAARESYIRSLLRLNEFVYLD